MTTFLDHCRLMARYNTWINAKVYDTAAKLPAGELTADRGAFFKSVIGTLNHLAVTDIMWLQRLRALDKAEPALTDVLSITPPKTLDQILSLDLGELRLLRERLDAAIEAYVGGLDAADFDVLVTFTRANGETQKKSLGSIFSHLFNHQTHHRGQITTLFSQAGLDVGVTDVNALTPNLI